ncbi:uncharacterized protein LOC103718831 [Phoenix dactylifera]|uniref:Uncharacterized protein LOC103718831 n=1 Tax=Phoenix dactylifera TaxID=42345 RepID=A0A8B9AK01_PHODC|nr:uncharacterized protein LOC103718831 [Phoenix dactylifera]
MAVFRLAAVIKKPSGEDFLVARQAPPPPLREEEYQKFVDSDLWDLPSASLNPLEGEIRTEPLIEGADSLSDKLELRRFDVYSALSQVLWQVGLVNAISGRWQLLKYVEEADFGPEPRVDTIFILGRLESEEEILQESCKWLSMESALQLLLEVKPSVDRVGPFVVIGLLPDSAVTSRLRTTSTLHCQEYPPGIMLVPMKSRTREPFHTTNLVVMVPNNATDRSEHSSFITYGDALLMDPGCCSQLHGELADLVAALPRKLVVFVTHHHYDHVDGLSVVQKCNPDATLLVHANTMGRIGKWTLKYSLITGGEKICIGGQQLEVISAPGHTDGHLALLHVSTNTLVVGDHCVGQGSAVLDVTSGGNMKDYFQTTYKFLDLSPHVLVPMHGRINLWPKQMLCGYLKHRRDRESSILKAIESGAETLFDIIAKSYPGLDIKLWLPASSNVRLHVDHLAHHQKLPKDFSMKKFQATCGVHFISRWIWTFLKRRNIFKVLAIIGVGGLAMAFSRKGKFGG